MNRAGHGCVQVTNFGVEGYVTTQGLILLTEQLKRRVRPDLVIFYDGFNDAYAGMYAANPREAHYAYYAIRDRVQGSPWGRFDFLGKLYSIRVAGAVRELFHRPQSPVSVDASAKAIATVDNYEANLSLINALSRAYDFKLYCFWQPTLLYGHKSLVPYEQQIVQKDSAGGRINAAAIAAVYEEAQSRSSRGASFVNLADLFDANASPLYLDEAHLGPAGNELVANTISKYIESHPGGTAPKAARPPDANVPRVGAATSHCASEPTTWTAR